MGTRQNVWHTGQCHMGNKQLDPSDQWLQVYSGPWQGLQGIFSLWGLPSLGHRPDQILLATFMLALEIKFERALYLHDEGYEASDDYDLPQPLNKSTLIYAVPLVATSPFNPTDYQKLMVPISLSTLKWRPVESQLCWVVHKWLNVNDSPLPAVNSNDDIEDNFPIAPLDDPVWSVKPIPDRNLYIHMALDKPETSYPSQIPT